MLSQANTQIDSFQLSKTTIEFLKKFDKENRNFI